MIKYIQALAGLLCLLMLSCSTDMEFDQEKWLEEFDGVYKYRDRMVNDLINNKKLNGITYDSLTSLLGPPQQYGQLKDNEVTYLIIEDYGTDIDPVYVKLLKIKLSADSTVVDYDVQEWEKE